MDIAKDELRRELIRSNKDLARSKGCRGYFECVAFGKIFPVLGDSVLIVETKKRTNDYGELYMHRNIGAVELAEAWSQQGWTAMVVRRGPRGFQGVKFHRAYRALLEKSRFLGTWTMIEIEGDWSYVFASDFPMDILAFASLVLPQDRPSRIFGTTRWPP